LLPVPPIVNVAVEAKPDKSAVRPVAPDVAMVVIAVLLVVTVKTPVPATLSVRKPVSVRAAKVVLAVKFALMVVTKLPFKVKAPKLPPPKFRANDVGLPVVRP